MLLSVSWTNRLFNDDYKSLKNKEIKNHTFWFLPDGKANDGLSITLLDTTIHAGTCQQDDSLCSIPSYHIEIKAPKTFWV